MQCSPTFVLRDSWAELGCSWFLVVFFFSSCASLVFCYFFSLLERATGAVCWRQPSHSFCNLIPWAYKPFQPKVPWWEPPCCARGARWVIAWPARGKRLLGSTRCREPARSTARRCAGRAGACTVRAGRGAAGGQGRATLMEHGVDKGLPGGQAAADGFSSCLVVYIIRMLSVTFGLRFFPSSPGLPNALMFCLVDVLPA